MPQRKISITNSKGEKIVGILEQKVHDNENYAKRKLVLICHGILGHKNYLFQSLLAQKLPYDSFRFDFRGNGESEGKVAYSNFEDDVEDIHLVVQWIQQQEYNLYAIIGHSRGSVISLTYATKINRTIPHIINISGRFLMPGVNTTHDEETKRLLRTQGYYMWKAKVMGRNIEVKVTNEDVIKFAAWDNEFVRTLPSTTSVLSIYGLEDKIVPPADAAHYANRIPNHTLRLIPGADHNFLGMNDPLIAVILEYFSDQATKERFWKKAPLSGGRDVIIPRWMVIEGVKNFRDLGGWRIGADGGYVRERTIYRSGVLSGITDKGIKALHALRITTIFDLRSIPELDQTGGIKEIPGIKILHTPVFKEEDFSPEVLAVRWKDYQNGAASFHKAYEHILREGTGAFRTILLHIAENPMPFLVHCTAGKDRTGILGMLILGICGVDDEVICHEYELTEKGFIPEESKMQLLMDVTGGSMEQIRIMLSAPYEAMKNTLALFRELYGTFDNYALGPCGLTTEQLSKVKNALVMNYDGWELQPKANL